MDKQALDRYITGNWGEDFVFDDSPDPVEDEMDKGEIIEFLINRRFITDDEALALAELSVKEIQEIYDGHVLHDQSSPEDEPAAPSGGRADEAWWLTREEEVADRNSRTETVGDCPPCGGTGNCYVCHGSGEHGDGECIACSGTGKCSLCGGTGDKPEEDEIDDDPQCVCGVYRSEHSMLGCPEGFQTPAEWNRERESIRARAFAGDEDRYFEYDEYD